MTGSTWLTGYEPHWTQSEGGSGTTSPTTVLPIRVLEKCLIGDTCDCSIHFDFLDDEFGGIHRFYVGEEVLAFTHKSRTQVFSLNCLIRSQICLEKLQSSDWKGDNADWYWDWKWRRLTELREQSWSGEGLQRWKVIPRSKSCWSCGKDGYGVHNSAGSTISTTSTSLAKFAFLGAESWCEDCGEAENDKARTINSAHGYVEEE